MSYKPIISKIRCHNPNLKSSKHANRENAHYIATREGTDFSEIPEEKQDNRMYNTATDEEYTRYIAKRPRSHGLFGNIDTDDLKSVEQLIYKTSQRGTNIYRGIISLSEQDAQELGYVNSSTWYQQLKSMMPDIAKELGISPTNFTWIGAFHAEPSHPHVHYQIWDNTDKIQSSFLHISVQKRCRSVIEKAIFSEEYEKSLQAVFEAEKDELYSIKNASRDQIMNYFKEVMDIKHVPGIEHTDLPSKLSYKETQNITAHLERLKEFLPESGRMYYKFMTPDIKKEIDKISDIIFKQSEMKAALSQYLQTANYIHQIKNPGYDKHAQDNAKKEIYRRAGNIVLKAVSDDLEQKLLYEEQIQENLITSQVESAQSILEITETAPDTIDNAVYLQEQDTTKALNILTDLSKQNNAEAQYTLGKFYLSEESSEYQNIPKALELLHASSDQGNQFAQYTLGKFYLSEKFPEYRDIPKALELLHASSVQGNQFAQYTLGKFYLSEEFPEYRNIPKTLELLRASSDQGNQFAQYTLGKFYLSEEFPEYQDIPKALELLHASSDQGNQFAQLKLGTIYLYGKYSVEKNEELGKEYLHSSAEQGNIYAKETLENYEFRHSPMYFMTSLIYRGIYTAMIQSSYKKRQQLEDIKRDLSKQARIEKRKQEEITHL